MADRLTKKSFEATTTITKPPRKEGYHPGSLELALSERLDVKGIYDESKASKKTLRQADEIVTFYRNPPELEHFYGIRLGIFTETVSTLKLFFSDPEKINEAAKEIANREANRLTYQTIQTENTFFQARTDLLTRLPNRAAFFDRVKKQVESGIPFGILLIDLDHFKKVNDMYGHKTGDQVLKNAASVITSCIRQMETIMPGGTRPEQDITDTDIAARYGGEEFTVMVNGAKSNEDLQGVAERIRTSVESLDIETGSRIIHLTTSIGGALFRPSEDPTTTIVRADDNLYKAKDSGRNRYQGDE